jgi:hypothetical protein
VASQLFNSITVTSIPAVIPVTSVPDLRALFEEACILTVLLADQDSGDHRKKTAQCSRMTVCIDTIGRLVVTSFTVYSRAYHSRFWCDHSSGVDEIFFIDSSSFKKVHPDSGAHSSEKTRLHQKLQ